jgi:hypothetical protein
MPHGQQRFQQQTIDGFVWIDQRREVDLLIPAGKQLVESVELGDKIIVQEEAGARRATSQLRCEIARHPGSVAEFGIPAHGLATSEAPPQTVERLRLARSHCLITPR